MSRPYLLSHSGVHLALFKNRFNFMAIDSVLMVNLLLAGPGFNPVHCVC